ncbi:MAG: pilus assembly protein [Propionibacteriaceae bacterium]|jgi:Flp pilus assembly protein TadG|nr:pilus assembly protein [Propionibacteriaceae bacterium]
MTRKRGRQTNTNLRAHTQGSVSIEAVILLPVFLLTLFLILQVSLWIHASSVAQAAALDGVRNATAAYSSSTQGERLAQAILDSRKVGQEWRITTTRSGSTLTLEITGQAKSVIPGWTWKVQESATLPLNGG